MDLLPELWNLVRNMLPSVSRARLRGISRAFRALDASYVSPAWTSEHRDLHTLSYYGRSLFNLFCADAADMGWQKVTMPYRMRVLRACYAGGTAGLALEWMERDYTRHDLLRLQVYCADTGGWYRDYGYGTVVDERGPYFCQGWSSSLEISMRELWWWPASGHIAQT